MSGPTFEEKLRTELQGAADAVPLPSRSYERAVRRAWQRRRRRQVAIATATALVAGAVALNAALHPATPDRDGSLDVGRHGADVVGPPSIVWRHTDGGVRSPRAVVQDDGGTVYALSTGPGVTADAHPDGVLPLALYRLADDGSWEPLALEDDRPRAQDLSTAGGVLYSITTEPGSSDPWGARVSTSDDGGRTWAHDDIPPSEAPSDEVPWTASISVQVASTADDTVALVSNYFTPDEEAIFPELLTGQDLHVQQYDGGYVLYHEKVEFNLDIVNGPPPGAPPFEPPPPTAPPPPTPGGEGVDDASRLDALPEGTVRTVTWEEMGIEGPDDVGPYRRVFRRSGNGWEDVPGANAALRSSEILDLDVAGGRFVAHGQDPQRTHILTSTDGTSWAPVTAPTHGQVLTMGSTLVAMPDPETTTAYASTDGGSTWADVELPPLAPGAWYTSATAGPLGFGYVAVTPDDRGGQPTHVFLTNDFQDWTVTPLDEVVGRDDLTDAELWIGEDRIVVTARYLRPEGGAPVSITAVGVPRRS